MKTTEIRLSDLKNKVAKSVLDTIRLLETRYGAMHYKDSGQKESPTWIYRLPRYDDAMVGIRMNKRDLTLYMHDRTCDGKYLRDTIAPKKVANVYPRDGRPAGSICRYLKPSSENEVLRLELGQEDIEAVLTAFFGELPVTSSASEIGSDRNKPVRNAADFLASLERKSEIGHLGECCALDDEIQRLKRLGCSRPEDYVLHVSLIDVPWLRY